MRNVIELLNSNNQVSDYKLNIRKKESFELFYVKGKLETIRKTNTCDKEVTVYVDHDEYKGDSQFFIYPSTTLDEIKSLIDDAVSKALLINNKYYSLPENEVGEYEVESNFVDYEADVLATDIAEIIFNSNDNENASLNSVEIFIYKYTDTIINSRGINKTQVRYDAMVETIPTYNSDTESVELYHQYNFNNLDLEEVSKEIKNKIVEVEARYKAIKPEFEIDCNVILNKLELSELFSNIVYDLNYGSIYSHSNVFKKGDSIQNNELADLISISMHGCLLNNNRSSKFDEDGISLDSIEIVKDGKVVNYFGSNKFGQYLNLVPTGNLRCVNVMPGTACKKCLSKAPYLEIVSMSGLQVDFYSDYIGGEIRLGYYNDGNNIIPVTGISFSGNLKEVLNNIRLSKETSNYDNYNGPAKAILSNVKIY